jgi:hypothetical protein
MWAARSESRKQIASAVSSGHPERPIGTLLCATAVPTGSVFESSVAMTPGCS